MNSTKIKLSPSLKRFFKITTDGTVLRQILDGFSAVYRGFLAKRYKENSKGSGDWPDITAETKRRRRTGKNGKRGGEKILIDTSALQHAVSIQTGLSSTPKFGPGGRNDVRISMRSVTIGFSPAAHPGKGTIDEIAEAHQQGAGYLPKREIVVEPDEKTMVTMVRVAEKTVDGGNA